MTSIVRHGRTCAIAARGGGPVPCPPGGCVLGRMLDPGRADVGDPCLVEEIADAAAGNPLVLLGLDRLRQELEQRYGSPAER